MRVRRTRRRRRSVSCVLPAARGARRGLAQRPSARTRHLPRPAVARRPGSGRRGRRSRRPSRRAPPASMPASRSGRPRRTDAPPGAALATPTTVTRFRSLRGYQAQVRAERGRVVGHDLSPDEPARALPSARRGPKQLSTSRAPTVERPLSHTGAAVSGIAARTPGTAARLAASAALTRARSPSTTFSEPTSWRPVTTAAVAA